MKFYMYFYIFFVFSLNCQLKSQVLDHSFPMVDAEIFSMASDNKYIYLAGNFLHIGYNTGASSIFENTIGRHLFVNNFPKIQGAVYSTIADGDGGWFLAGDFNLYNDFSFKNLIRIDEKGELDSSWKIQIDFAVYSIAKDEDYLYLGGDFTIIDGDKVERLARLELKSTNLDKNWIFNVNNSVLNLEVFDNEIYVGGDFNQINLLGFNSLAKIDLNINYLVDTWKPAIDGTVKSLKINDSSIYVGGNFIYIDNFKSQNLLKIDTKTGIPDQNWKFEMDGVVNCLKIVEKSLFVGGSFNSINNKDIKILSAINLETGKVDENFRIKIYSGNLDNKAKILALEELDNYLYVGGDFEAVDDNERSNIFKVDLNSNKIDSVFNPNSNGAIYAFSLIKDNILISGEFNSIGRLRFNRLARVKLSNNEIDLNWKPNPNNTPLEVVCKDNNIYVCGYFTHIANNDISFLAKFDSFGNLDAKFRPKFDNLVYSIAALENDLFVGGRFSIVNDREIRNFAKINIENGKIDETWNLNVNGSITKVKATDFDVFIAGNFTRVDNNRIRQLCRINKNNGKIYTEWSFNFDNSIQDILVDNQSLYVGGSFNKVNEDNIPKIAKIDLKSLQLDDNLINTIDSLGEIKSMSIDNGFLYVGGSFSSVNGFRCNSAARINLFTKLIDSSWNVRMSPVVSSAFNKKSIVYSLYNFDSTIYVGGFFDRMGSNQLRGIAKFNSSDLSLYIQQNDILYNDSFGKIFPNPVNHTHFNLEYPGSEGILNFTIYDVKGQKMVEYENVTAISKSIYYFNLPTNLMNGIYYITTMINGHLVSKKFMIYK